MPSYIHQTRRINGHIKRLLKLCRIHRINHSGIWNSTDHAQIFCRLMMNTRRVGNAWREPNHDACQRACPHADHHLIIGASCGIAGKGRRNRHIACFCNTSSDRDQILFSHANIKMLVRKLLFHLYDLAIFAQISTHDNNVFASCAEIKADIIKGRRFDYGRAIK